VTAAFQADAFQADAFQVDAAATPVEATPVVSPVAALLAGWRRVRDPGMDASQRAAALGPLAQLARARAARWLERLTVPIPEASELAAIATADVRTLSDDAVLRRQLAEAWLAWVALGRAGR
jgi:hypothetical protein